MLIPSIDLRGGRVVQLVQGRSQALAFDNVEEWIEKFDGHPRVQLIDLDAAMGTGDNRELVGMQSHFRFQMFDDFSASIFHNYIDNVLEKADNTPLRHVCRF